MTGMSSRRATYDDDLQRFNVETLFNLRQFVPNEFSNLRSGETKNILVTSEGTIWVCTRFSLFRFSDGTLNEFNYFKEPHVFPAKSLALHKVIETNDGRIRVVASDNRETKYRGEPLTGGLLEWTPKNRRFVALSIEPELDWFVHSYTSIDRVKAIIGTTSGFQLEKDGAIESFKAAGNDSYKKIYKEHPSLFLGTEGISYGKHWLFGCASGVLAYKDNKWTYLEKLNELLPDDFTLGHLGSRHVNALSTDNSGRIFVGTDRGLLILDLNNPLDLFDGNPGDQKVYLNR